MVEEKKNLHIIIYSTFPGISGGRENWLFHVLPFLSNHFKDIYLYTVKSNQRPFYNLGSLKNVAVKEIFSLRSYGLLFLLANRISLQSLFLLDNFVIFRKNVRSVLRKMLNSEDTVLAMNSIAETMPGIDLKKEKHHFRLTTSVRGLVPLEYSLRAPLLKNWFEKVEKANLTQCDAVLANGYDTQSYLKDKGITSIVVPNGVDLNLFKSIQTFGKELDPLMEIINQGTKIIMMVASLRGIKGTEALIFTGKKLKDLGAKDFKIVFIGKGNPTAYKQKAAALGIEKEVVFLGEQQNISGFLQLADIVVCISGGSGMSMSALEAMAVGKPIVAWDTPVYQQILSHMEDSYLAEHGNIEKLAQGIKLFMDNPSFGQEFSLKLKAKACSYDWSVVANKLIEHLLIPLE
jgi:glycosyltransferase involved in cell wall biosynthesis